MGEVYRARDTKPNRDVAIKVLPELLFARLGIVEGAVHPIQHRAERRHVAALVRRPSLGLFGRHVDRGAKDRADAGHVSSDGRFLMIEPSTSNAQRFNVVLNWAEELKRLIPAN
jgi:hypothetical protein